MLSNENAVLVTLSTKNWSGYKYDKKLSAETKAKHKMDDNAGRFNKKLLSKRALQPMQRVLNDFKTYFRENTLPYSGLLSTRILPATDFMEFNKRVDEAQKLLARRMAKFLADWDNHIKEAQEDLGDAFDPKDYPDPAKLPFAFKLEVNYMPVPVTSTFNATIGNTQIQKLNEQLNAISENSVDDLFSRVAETLAALLDTVNRPDKRIYQTTIEGNLEKVCEQIDKLNFTQNPLLIHLRNEIKKDLSKIDANYLRDSKTYRKKLGEKIIAIQNQLPEKHRAVSNSGVPKV